MDRHFDLLGYLFLGYGALLVLVGFFIGAVLGGAGALSGDPGAVRVLGAVSGLIWVLLLVLAVPYGLAGYGLLKRLPWARILAMVLGALALLSFPLGTALGAYALWALTRPEAEDAFA